MVGAGCLSYQTLGQAVEELFTEQLPSRIRWNLTVLGYLKT